MLKMEDQFTHNRETEAWENQKLPPQEVRQCLQSSEMEDTKRAKWTAHKESIETKNNQPNGKHTKRAINTLNKQTLFLATWKHAKETQQKLKEKSIWMLIIE